MKTKNGEHTPGPWKYDDTWSLIVGPQGEEIAAVHAAGNQRRVNRNVALANAALLTAGPELIHAAEMALDALESQSGGCNCEDSPEPCVICALKTAIEKATP